MDDLLSEPADLSCPGQSCARGSGDATPGGQMGLQVNRCQGYGAPFGEFGENHTRRREKTRRGWEGSSGLRFFSVFAASREEWKSKHTDVIGASCPTKLRLVPGRAHSPDLPPPLPGAILAAPRGKELIPDAMNDQRARIRMGATQVKG